MLLAAIAAGLGLLVGVGGNELRRFERAAAEDIASRLEGDSKHVEVTARIDGLIDAARGSLKSAEITARDFHVDGLPLFTEPERSKSGAVGTLQLRLYDFQLRDLRIEELTADIEDCKYDFGLALRERKIRLSKSGKGPGYVRVSEQALEDFILKKYGEIDKVSVRLKKYRAFVEGHGDFGLFESDFFVIARLEPLDGTKIILADATVFLDGTRVRDISERAFLQALNPVLDINADLHLRSAIEMERIEITEGYLEVFGIAVIPDRPVPAGNLVPDVICGSSTRARDGSSDAGSIFWPRSR